MVEFLHKMVIWMKKSKEHKMTLICQTSNPLQVSLPWKIKTMRATLMIIRRLILLYKLILKNKVPKFKLIKFSKYLTHLNLGQLKNPVKQLSLFKRKKVRSNNHLHLKKFNLPIYSTKLSQIFINCSLIIEPCISHLLHHLNSKGFAMMEGKNFSYTFGMELNN